MKQNMLFSDIKKKLVDAVAELKKNDQKEKDN